MALPPDVFEPHPPRRSRGLPVWLPWLCAPGFMLLPMAGCGIAGTFKQPDRLVRAAVRPPAGPAIGQFAHARAVSRNPR